MPVVRDANTLALIPTTVLNLKHGQDQTEQQEEIARVLESDEVGSCPRDARNAKGCQDGAGYDRAKGKGGYDMGITMDRIPENEKKEQIVDVSVVDDSTLPPARSKLALNSRSKKARAKRLTPAPLACAIYGRPAPPKSNIQPVRKQQGPFNLPRSNTQCKDAVVDSASADVDTVVCEVDEFEDDEEDRSWPEQQEVHLKSIANAVSPSCSSVRPKCVCPRTSTKSPSRPRFSDIDKYLHRMRRRRPASARSGSRLQKNAMTTVINSDADPFVCKKRFTDVCKELKSYRSLLDHIVGREKLHNGHSATLPGKVKATVPVSKLIELSVLLEQSEAELRSLRQREEERHAADEKCMKAMGEQLATVCKDVERSMTKHVRYNQGGDKTPRLESVTQAELWLQQAKVVQAVVGGEYDKTGSVENGVRNYAGDYNPLFFPNLATQVLSVSCGISQALSQACREGLESADSIIRHLFEVETARDPQKINKAPPERKSKQSPSKPGYSPTSRTKSSIM